MNSMHGRPWLLHAFDLPPPTSQTLVFAVCCLSRQLLRTSPALRAHLSHSFYCQYFTSTAIVLPSASQQQSLHSFVHIHRFDFPSNKQQSPAFGQFTQGTYQYSPSRHSITEHAAPAQHELAQLSLHPPTHLETESPRAGELATPDKLTLRRCARRSL